MYFVGYLIRGEAAAWHMSVVKHVAERFNSKKLYEKVPPHLTLYRPFTTNDIESIKEILRSKTSASLPWGYIEIQDYSHFGDRVVFAKAEVEEAIRERVSDLQESLRVIRAMPENHKEWNPHATIAYRMPEERIREIWEYVATL